MKNISIWQKDIKNSSKDSKFNLDNLDILIIGAGITGITTAYFLKDSNKKIAVIDKGNIGNGITAKTTAKITYLEQDIYRQLTNIHGLSIAKKYYEAKKEAIDILKSIITENKIACDFEKVSSIIFTNKDNFISKLNEEKQILLSWNVKVSDYQDDFIKHGIIVDDTYTFNPIKYLNGLSKIVGKSIPIYENILVTSMKKDNDVYVVDTDKGIIKTKEIVIACHYPFFIIPSLFPLKTYIEREYVSAAKVDKPKNITAINIDNDLYSVRYYQDYLIYGCYDHKLTSKIDYAKHYQESRNKFKKYFKKEPEYIWMNQDIISNDKLPFIGKLKEHLYISTSYNTLV